MTLNSYCGVLGNDTVEFGRSVIHISGEYTRLTAKEIKAERKLDTVSFFLVKKLVPSFQTERRHDLYDNMQTSV